MDKIIPGFILKLWKMINDPQCDYLMWSDNGQSFIITDPPKFAQELSKYFKHNNLSSFIRQLNMYGFRKVATIENITANEDLHFYHPDFVRGQPERLEAIKRKLPQKLAETVDLKNVIKGISDIENKHNDVNKTLSEIKRENEMLWAELHDLRQKHQQQQLYMTRLMKLVFEAMEKNGIKTNMLPIVRNSPLMIEGTDDSSHTRKRTRTSFEEDNSAYELATTTTTSTVTTTPSATTYDCRVPLQQQQLSQQQSDLQSQLDLQSELQFELQSELQSDFQMPKDMQVELETQPELQQQQQQLPTTSAYADNQTTTTLIEPGSYQTLAQSIDCNGEQLDNLAPSILDFNDSSIDYNEIFASNDM